MGQLETNDDGFQVRRGAAPYLPDGFKFEFTGPPKMAVIVPKANTFHDIGGRKWWRQPFAEEIQKCQGILWRYPTPQELRSSKAALISKGKFQLDRPILVGPGSNIQGVKLRDGAFRTVETSEPNEFMVLCVFDEDELSSTYLNIETIIPRGFHYDSRHKVVLEASKDNQCCFPFIHASQAVIHSALASGYSRPKKNVAICALAVPIRLAGFSGKSFTRFSWYRADCK